MSEIQLRIRISDDDDLAAAQKASEVTSVDFTEELEERDPTKPQPAIVPVVAILIGAAVLVAALFVKEWIQTIPGGTVIDMRSDAPDNLYRDKALPFGVIVIWASDGKVTLETKELPKTGIERLIGDVISGVLGTVTAIDEKVAELKAELLAT